ncbi:hypothetical protein [Streptomyces sp. H27-H5]|uniref:hypothetical protein n=1 Tax=Streptomyces sp. H27-H5 TaxID=2996460 RepID=UPI0022704B03|nr:hypothetical protein [Streptomyces sp. H27-H5]MCY0957676.1 hypothetical protein [Streptomyces sp. H27-H5]
MLRLDTAAQARAFLALCLDPGSGRAGRTLPELVAIMPPWLQGQVDTHAPHLADLRAEADRLKTAATAAQTAYAEALGTWITDTGKEPPTP